jgi:hypothetical protein
MKKFLAALAAGSLLAAAFFSVAVAQDDDAAASAVPVEIYACSYADGRGPADLDAVTASWTTWADDAGIDNYSAWILTKFYAGPEQDFDYLWLGVSPTAKDLGAIQDKWLATGAEVGAEFDRVSPCDGHSNFASVNFKQPPQNDDPSDNIVLTFSDCKIAEGKTFDDVAPAITAWTKFRTDQGSESGHWILFPAYGGGGEEFDFKWVSGHATHEAQGVDWDSYDGDLDSQLFDGVIDCDSARVYNAKNVRRAASDDD